MDIFRIILKAFYLLEDRVQDHVYHLEPSYIKYDTGFIGLNALVLMYPKPL